MHLRSGRAEALPYSLSRWTDVPAAKWPWFLDRMKAGRMEGFDPRTAVPSYWSLKPEDTLGLIFWTKNPENLWRWNIENREVRSAYNMRVNVTITGWHEEEPGVPDAMFVADMTRALALLIGGWRITWRFSPVPMIGGPDYRLDGTGLFDRFEKIAERLEGCGVENVFLSFLQTNDRISETRTPEERIKIMRQLAKLGGLYGMKVRLCNEDRSLLGVEGLPANLAPGVCAPPEDFALSGLDKPPSEGCGCSLAVEPFTINESCSYGCRYCYAADETLAGRKHNTTKGLRLPVVR